MSKAPLPKNLSHDQGYIDAVRSCRQLWQWLARNPGKSKEEWPGWEKRDLKDVNGDVITKNECFACELCDTKCEDCFLLELWIAKEPDDSKEKSRKMKGLFGPCETANSSPYYKSMYRFYNSTAREKKSPELLKSMTKQSRRIVRYCDRILEALGEKKPRPRDRVSEEPVPENNGGAKPRGFVIVKDENEASKKMDKNMLIDGKVPVWLSQSACDGLPHLKCGNGNTLLSLEKSGKFARYPHVTQKGVVVDDEGFMVEVED
jgi:hypothetical protein